MGNRPYDETIRPADNGFTSLLSLGEGYHNYHHVFPQDYKAAEFGNYKLNLTTSFIHFLKWLGWAYDFKTVDRDMLLKRIARSGDGTYPAGNAAGGKNETKED